MLLSCYGVFLSELLRAAAVPMAPSSAEQESLSGGEASGGYGSAPGARSRGHARSLSLGMDDAVGYCEATEEDERQARLLTRRLALDDAPPEFSRFVKLEGPDEVAVIVPHTLHFLFFAIEHGQLAVRPSLEHTGSRQFSFTNITFGPNIIFVVFVVTDDTSRKREIANPIAALR